ncbi:CDP-glycerol glycerophosphotransferase family protein [Dysgonomonas sp. Marseille-P4677]|uniref:CDP-glycerol glycerophosphotransferase family protein n=1 Tax=Dysgonomonas sp. Marseille-P4677 TaxID=2364790 RepID=UPI001913CB17|nr:CDP-glycerol glycerophosphotransferase family protein [Dysgonomonas sp. Marseille-P4677]MBK5722407.1 CDP-glycerol glycerophosphotransferase family protein [Dysgonomonas sp. Marseille-P4677]
MKKYLFFVSYSYSFSILRPLQDAIWKRGDDVAWFIEDSSPLCIRENEKHLKTIEEVMYYDPIAVFVPGVRVYDFIPGIKVQIFHGLYYKRSNFGDHYKIRGFFDIYCTTSPMFTPRFKELERKYGFFKVYETGWSKFDNCLSNIGQEVENEPPTIIYAPTFTKGLESASVIYSTIEELIIKKNWNWIFSFHPKMDKKVLSKYKYLADKYDNVTFSETEEKASLFRSSDVMLSDTSSVIYEFLWFNKPAVTYKNTFPANHLLNVERPDEIEGAIMKALQRPEDLMNNIKAFMDKVHPFRDGKSSERILDATDDFILNYQGKLKKKPLILYRRLKLRRKAGYFPFGPKYKKSKS